jgi:outer membrane protein OmpA-like peptidoglycan-associated protein
MRRFIPIPLVVLCLAAPASAQVTVDLHALDALPRRTPEAPVRRAPPPVAASEPSTASAHPAAQTAPTAAGQPPAAGDSASPAPAASSTGNQTVASVPAAAAPVTPAPPPATLPSAPPPTASLAPIAPPAPVPGSAPPPPPPIVAGAATAAAATQAGLRLTFASGQSDLSPASAASIGKFVQDAPHTDSTTFNVLAYAAGVPDDPSAPRRLSLSRALAVRGVLIADGVPSSRIYLRALGAPTGEGPPDRVDLSVLGGNAAGQTQQ